MINLPFPNKKYQIIYADPPWPYNDKMKMNGVHGMIRGAESFYKTIPLEIIKNLPIQNITNDNCVLFLWVTMPLLQEGLDVIKAWNFKYKTCGFTWVKTTKKNKIHCGMGHYTRGNAELCLIGVKGKLERMDKSISQIVISKINRHSEKPSEVRNRITKLFGDLPRIELFARPPKDRLFEDESYMGWDVWGNEC